MVSKLGTEELTSDEERHLRKEMLNQLGFYFTDEVRAERGEDKVENGLYFFACWDSITIIWDIRLALKPIVNLC